jgi:hypothetical protein
MQMQSRQIRASVYPWSRAQGTFPLAHCTDTARATRQAAIPIFLATGASETRLVDLASGIREPI